MSLPTGTEGPTRREFVRGAVAAAAGIALPLGESMRRLHATASWPPTLASAIDSVGIQLYTLRRLFSADVEGTLDAVAGIGYREIEFAGLGGKTPAEMRSLLDQLGLRAVSSHNGLADIRGDWERTLEGASALGQRYIVCPSIDGRDRSGEGLRAVADAFNRAGEAASRHGIVFGYHNHDWEFSSEDDVLPYDLLLERCDPALVTMQMDLHWIVHAGVDPMSYIARHPGRFHSVHAKDRTADGRMVNVGEGVIDFAAIHAASDEAGIRHWFVEHDSPQDPLADVTVSFRALSSIGSSRPL